MGSKMGRGAVAIGAVVLATVLVAPSNAGPPQTEATGAGWEPPVLVSSTKAHRETSLALSPKDPNLLFACDPSGVPAINEKQSYFHRSTNGGANWASLKVEGGTTDGRNATFEGGDCDVEFDKGGTMYSADTWLGSLSIGHSSDGGNTWDGTPIAATSPVVDRPWLVGGPPGTLYVTYQDLQCCLVSAIWFTKTTDYGKTFLPAVPVADAGPDGAFTWEGNFVVSPSGNDLYLVYTRRTGPALGSLDSSGPETVWVAASHNGGLTWTSQLVAAMQNPASYLYPSIAMDAGGNLHVVYASRRSSDRPIWYTTSKDQAKTWTAPVALTSGTAGYSPWVAAGAAGEAAVIWYGSPNPAATETVDAPWFFYWAKVKSGADGNPTITSGTTTQNPIFTGKSGIPEFEMVRLGPDGRMHIGMSAYRKAGSSAASWAIYYQREKLPALDPPTP